jgi:MFS family permease
MLTKETIEKYFNGEKAESTVFLALGIVAIGVALYFWLGNKNEFFKGMAYPLLAIGLLLAVVGTTVFLRSDNDRIRNVYALGMTPNELKDKEIPRMEKVMQSFKIYRYVEIALILTGFGLYFLYKQKPLIAGIGAGLVIMAAAALIADYFAEKRGHIYLNDLTAFVAQKS